MTISSIAEYMEQMESHTSLVDTQNGTASLEKFGSLLKS